MSKRSIIALALVALLAVLLLAGGHHLWNALLVMHGVRPK
jgi:hypothetical protein